MSNTDNNQPESHINTNEEGHLMKTPSLHCPHHALQPAAIPAISVTADTGPSRGPQNHSTHADPFEPVSVGLLSMRNHEYAAELSALWTDVLNRVLDLLPHCGLSMDDITASGFPHTLYLGQFGELALVESPSGPRAAVRSTQLARLDVLIPLLPIVATRPFAVSDTVVDDILIAIRRLVRHRDTTPSTSGTDPACLGQLVYRSGWERSRSPHRGWDGVAFKDSACRVRGELVPARLDQYWGIHGGITLTLSFSDIGLLEASEILSNLRRIADELRTSRNRLHTCESQLNDHHEGEGFIPVQPPISPTMSGRPPVPF